MVLLDRTHTLKVQQIQKEYQDFMERIRNKAQVGLCVWGVGGGRDVWVWFWGGGRSGVKGFV
jgi:hypothetical protein